MGNGIAKIKVMPVRGGLEVIGVKRSARGTSYYGPSVVVLTEGKSKEEIKTEVDAIITRLYDAAV